MILTFDGLYCQIGNSQFQSHLSKQRTLETETAQLYGQKIVDCLERHPSKLYRTLLKIIFDGVLKHQLCTSRTRDILKLVSNQFPTPNPLPCVLLCVTMCHITNPTSLYDTNLYYPATQVSGILCLNIRLGNCQVLFTFKQ